jgi:hypothetical protein
MSPDDPAIAAMPPTMRPTADSAAARAVIVDAFRRDLVGPLPVDMAPGDADLQEERLAEAPSSWYLTGFIGPVEESAAAVLRDDPDAQEESETEAGDLIDEGEDALVASPADDDPPPEAPTTRRRLVPNSIGLTVLVPEEVEAVDVRVTWGDYATEPPLPEHVLVAEADDKDAPKVHWVRRPREQIMRVPIPRSGKGAPIVVPGSAAEQHPGGALELVSHARPFTIEEPGEAPRRVRALSVFVVNRRTVVRRKYADVAYTFQVRLEVISEAGLVPRRDLSGYRSDDEDLRTADLHYCHEAEYGVGRNVSAGWAAPDGSGVVRRAWTDPLPMAEVERVAPNEAIEGVEFGMEALAELAGSDGAALDQALSNLPVQYGRWIEAQRGLLAGSRSAGARQVSA